MLKYIKIKCKLIIILYYIILYYVILYYIILYYRMNVYTHLQNNMKNNIVVYKEELMWAISNYLMNLRFALQ